MRHKPEAYEIYRDSKGKLYQIVAVAKNSEDGSKQVVYQALFAPFEIYVRPLEMFMSEVDRAECPDAPQQYEFEPAGKPDMPDAGGEIDGAEIPDGPENLDLAVESGGVIGPDAAVEPDGVVGADAAVEPDGVTGPEDIGAAGEPDELEDLDADEVLDPLLLEFLDSDTYEQKLNILTALHGRITQDMINTIAMALDIEVAPGDLEERYDQVRSCLLTFEKYECNRLR